MYSLLKKCIAPLAPSCREQEMTDFVLAEVQSICDECYTTPLGNVIAVKYGCGAHKKKLMYCAHMDEVGFIVSYIEDNGYIRFFNTGGPNMTSAAYQEVRFANGTHGILIPNAGCDNSANCSNTVLDIGARSKKEAQRKVKIGDTFAVLSHVTKLTSSVVTGRPLDNRIGVAIQLQALRTLSERAEMPYNDVYFAFTVQEECTANGGSTAAASVQPDIGIAIDVCSTGDAIGVTPMECRVGSGAAICIRDCTIICDQDVIDAMTKVAEEKKIPYQYEIAANGGTDAVPMQKVGLGAKAGVLSIPMRNLHTSAELLDLKDAEACREIALALCDHVF